jgi:hypothetical protein
MQQSVVEIGAQQAVVKRPIVGRDRIFVGPETGKVVFNEVSELS